MTQSKPIEHSPAASDGLDSRATDTENNSTAQEPRANGLFDLIVLLSEKVDPIIKVVTTTLEGYQKGQEREIRFQIQMAWVAVSVVFVIIGVAAALTYVGKIDGSTFTFLLGLIVGYVLTFIRDQIRTPES